MTLAWSFGGDLVIDSFVTANGTIGLSLQPTSAYRGNHLYGNTYGAVSGGFSLGGNVCAYQQAC